MRDGRDWEGSLRRFAIITAVFLVAIAILRAGPWNISHVAPNPGPSGTPGSMVLDETPPPAVGPSGTTTGVER
jgi:hypothetical protein